MTPSSKNKAWNKSSTPPVVSSRENMNNNKAHDSLMKIKMASRKQLSLLPLVLPLLEVCFLFDVLHQEVVLSNLQLLVHVAAAVVVGSPPPPAPGTKRTERSLPGVVLAAEDVEDEDEDAAGHLHGKQEDHDGKNVGLTVEQGSLRRDPEGVHQQLVTYTTAHQKDYRERPNHIYSSSPASAAPRPTNSKIGKKSSSATGTTRLHPPNLLVFNLSGDELLSLHPSVWNGKTVSELKELILFELLKKHLMEEFRLTKKQKQEFLSCSMLGPPAAVISQLGLHIDPEENPTVYENLLQLVDNVHKNTPLTVDSVVISWETYFDHHPSPSVTRLRAGFADIPSRKELERVLQLWSRAEYNEYEEDVDIFDMDHGHGDLHTIGSGRDDSATATTSTPCHHRSPVHDDTSKDFSDLHDHHDVEDDSHWQPFLPFFRKKPNKLHRKEAEFFYGPTATWSLGEAVTHLGKTKEVEAAILEGGIWRPASLARSGRRRPVGCGVFCCSDADHKRNNWPHNSGSSWSSLFHESLIISNWKTSFVKSMRSLFEDCDDFNQQLNWDVSGVTNFSKMFRNARKYNDGVEEEVDLHDREVQHLGDVGAALLQLLVHTSARNNYNAPGTSSVVHRNGISAWDVSKGEDFSDMFRGARAFSRPLREWRFREETSRETTTGRRTLWTIRDPADERIEYPRLPQDHWFTTMFKQCPAFVLEFEALRREDFLRQRINAGGVVVAGTSRHGPPEDELPVEEDEEDFLPLFGSDGEEDEGEQELQKSWPPYYHDEGGPPGPGEQRQAEHATRRAPAAAEPHYKLLTRKQLLQLLWAM
ncbi:unnamed protein product [Amoebophrya sp. A120]|nr:unnamed protein product [Amoebophrya sp. A120]|eukprot:GSA120T00020381001.1